MTKRAREEDEFPESQPSAKRKRHSTTNSLASLSNELVLRIFSFLPVSQLVLCERLSHKFRTLAIDSQLWKALYYERFVHPRVSRVPGAKHLTEAASNILPPSKRSRWLEDQHLVKRGKRTNWKRQYKLRHNWTQGSCAVSEFPVSEEPRIPPTLVQMHRGVIYMADKTDGLRAWSAKDRKIVAQATWPKAAAKTCPTTLAVDKNLLHDGIARLVVGFEDGSFSLYELHHEEHSFEHRYSHETSPNGVLSSTALSWPYVVTMSVTQILSLYHFREPVKCESKRPVLDPPLLLHSLRSQSVWPPLSTSLRTTAQNLVVCIAYALPTYLSGWTVGIQEVKLSRDGVLLDSRVASAIDQHYRPLAFSTPPLAPYLGISVPASMAASSTAELRHIHAKPTSLSYSHPYLLVSHPDNTLTLYLVSSTAESLSISSGSRLWGHTSSVSGAHVGDRGKAVSVSRRGDELRVWELEGGFASTAARKRLATGSLSVQVKPGSSQVRKMDNISRALARRSGSDCGKGQAADEVSDLTVTRGWIGFDEENVVLLKEKSQGSQALVVYDFT